MRSLISSVHSLHFDLCARVCARARTRVNWVDCAGLAVLCYYTLLLTDPFSSFPVHMKEATQSDQQQQQSTNINIHTICVSIVTVAVVVVLVDFQFLRPFHFAYSLCRSVFQFGFGYCCCWYCYY